MVARERTSSVTVEVEARIVGGNSRPTGIEKVILELAQTRITVVDLVRRTVEEQVWNLLSKAKVARETARVSLDRLYLTGGAGQRLEKPKKVPKVDPEAEVRRALQAFQAGTYLVFVDGRQVTDLREELTLGESARVSFLRLTPLVGG